MTTDEPVFSPDPITLVCLLAAFGCGLGAWADLLAPGMLHQYGKLEAATIVRTEARALAHGAHEDVVVYKTARGEFQERVTSLADFGMPRDGQRVYARRLSFWPNYTRLVGNESAGISSWLLATALILGVAGLGNFRNWRYVRDQHGIG
jgi:hypothetical protein